MIKPKEILLSLLIIFLSFALVLISKLTNDIYIFKNLSKSINKQFVYQSVTLFVTFIFLIILKASKKHSFLIYFNKGDISADIKTEPVIGLKPKPTENWWHIGRNFAIIISIVTAIVIYFQLTKESKFTVTKLLCILPFSIMFALTNSFVEESITRLGLVVVLKDVLNDKIIPLISAIIFGTVHYWGNPGGLAGVLVAGFLGWFLAKSILETKGIFWAWLIHFLQDVIILSALLATT